MQMGIQFGLSWGSRLMAAQLTTMDLVRKYLGRDYKGTDDELIEQMIMPSAAEWFVREANNPIVVSAHVDYFDGCGQRTHVTRYANVKSVSRVMNDSSEVIARERYTDHVGYVVDGDQIILVGEAFRQGTRNCSVAYTAGYDDIPYIVTLAATELTIYLYRERDRVGVFSRSGEMGTVQYQVLSLPVTVQRVIDQYRVPPEN
jgi:hypothetical protein